MPRTRRRGTPAPRRTGLSSRLVYPMDFDIPQFDFLHVGRTCWRCRIETTMSTVRDLLIVPELRASVVDDAPLYRYFPRPDSRKVEQRGTEIWACSSPTRTISR